MSVPIIWSKFYAPTYSAVLPRERLFTRLDEAVLHSLTLICADAGYGKSTLVATYLENRSRVGLWLQLDEFDRDPDVLFAHLYTGLAERLPASNTRLRTLVAQLGERKLTPPDLVVNLVGAIPKKVLEPILLILDGFEVVQKDPGVIGAIQQLVRHLPEAVRLVVLSRTRPEELPLTRLSLEERLVEFNRADLAFTPEEVQGLFAKVYGLRLSFGELQLVQRLCEGWPVGLRLLAEALRRVSGPERIDFWLNLERTSDVYRYLWREALSHQLESTRDFLLRTSILASLEPDITDALLDITRSRHILAELVRKQLFTFVEGEGQISYRYHGLFRTFLHHQLEQEVEPEALREMHLRAAVVYRQKGRFIHAIGHFLAGRDYIQAARMMSEVVDVYSPRTFLRLFDGWLEEQAPGARTAYPSLFIRRVFPLEKWAQLTSLLEEMLEEAKASGDLLRQAHLHHRLANVPFYQHEVDVALYHYEKSAELFELLHDPTMEALSLSQMGRLLWWAGDIERAREYCEQSLTRCHRHHLAMPQMHSLWVLSEIALGLGELERAERLARMAIQASSEKREPGTFVYLTGVLAFLDCERGDFTSAVEKANEALNYSKDRGVWVDQGWGAYCAGSVNLLAGDLELAYSSLIRAADLLEGYAALDMIISVRLAVIHLQWGEQEEAIERLSFAFGLANERELDHPLLLEFSKFPAIPAFALENDIHMDYLLSLVGRLPEEALKLVSVLVSKPRQPNRSALAQVLAKVGVSQQPEVAHPDESGYLKIQALGSFSVYLGEVDLTQELNQRKSCRRLLLFFLANRQRAVPRDQIVEALWRDVSAPSGTNRFNVALHWLRKILEPTLESGDDSRVIRREVDRYWLVSDSFQLDVDVYLQMVLPLVHGSQRRKLSPYEEQGLVYATALYGGDFLRDYPYEDFLIRERDRLREIQRTALVRLGDHYRLNRQGKRSLHYYQAALVLDGCSETVQRRVIFAHLLAGDRSGAIRAWQDCVRTLEVELGVKPERSTQILAEILLRINGVEKGLGAQNG